MLVADAFLGNCREDDKLARRVESEDTVTVVVGETERRRSRFRTTMTDGRDLGVTVGRHLRSGDVLGADDTLVVVELDVVEAMVIDFTDAEGTLTGAVRLGHALGNRHWNLSGRDGDVVLPVTDSKERMEREVRPLLPAGATIDYESVSPSLFDEPAVSHSHTHGRDLTDHHIVRRPTEESP